MKEFNDKQIEILKGFWEDVEAINSKYYTDIEFVEQQLKHILEIEIEVFHADGVAVGFGDYAREYKLWQGE
jgi:hypothetical protein